MFVLLLLFRILYIITCSLFCSQLSRAILVIALSFHVLASRLRTSRSPGSSQIPHGSAPRQALETRIATCHLSILCSVSSLGEYIKQCEHTTATPPLKFMSLTHCTRTTTRAPNPTLQDHHCLSKLLPIDSHHLYSSAGLYDRESKGARCVSQPPPSPS